MLRVVIGLNAHSSKNNVGFPVSASSFEEMNVSLEKFNKKAKQWLDENAQLVSESSAPKDPSSSNPDFNVAVFHALGHEKEKALLNEAKAWNQKKAHQGYHAITWEPKFGGLGLSREHAREFAKLERQYKLPERHETFNVTTGLIAPTVEVFGTEEQKDRFIAQFLSTQVLCCQLFSEPGAGSDLAGLACRAEQDGEEWVVNGQKVWSSGAQFSEWGQLIARTDPKAPKHKGMTAFLVPLDLPGIEIRPIRQMSGGSSFSEVFFDNCRIPASLRLGPIGEGWKVALTTLSFERDRSNTEASGGTRKVGGSWHQLLATASTIEATKDKVTRQALMKMYTHSRIENLLNRRAADLARGGAPGPEGSLGKLMWTEGMSLMSDVVSSILGLRLVANSGEPGTYTWTEHVLGAPGYRIAGGSDEIQRNIIAERVLGLPSEPKIDKDIAWKDIPR